MSSTKIIYNYDENGVYTGQGIAQIDPMDNTKFLAPAMSTEITPPSFSNEQIPVFSNNNWSLVEDNRGKLVYDKTTGDSFVINSVGSLPSNVTLVKPPINPSIKYLFDETTKSWIIDPSYQKQQDIMNRNAALYSSDTKVIRYNSELTLVNAKLLDKTTNTSDEMLQWETYRMSLRNYLNIDYTPGKPLPIAPNIK